MSIKTQKEKVEHTGKRRRDVTSLFCQSSKKYHDDIVSPVPQKKPCCWTQKALIISYQCSIIEHPQADPFKSDKHYITSYIKLGLKSTLAETPLRCPPLYINSPVLSLWDEMDSRGLWWHGNWFSVWLMAQMALIDGRGAVNFGGTLP